MDIMLPPPAPPCGRDDFDFCRLRRSSACCNASSFLPFGTGLNVSSSPSPSFSLPVASVLSPSSRSESESDSAEEKGNRPSASSTNVMPRDQTSDFTV